MTVRSIWMLLLLGSSLTVFAQSQLLSESEIPSQTQAQTQAQPLAPPVVGQEIDANAGAWEDRVDVLTEQAAELWQRSQQQADDLWQRSRQSADDWWQRSREATLDAWEDARDTLTPTEADAFGQVWTNVVPKLEETVSLEEAQKDLPDKAWFTRDKADAHRCSGFFYPPSNNNLCMRANDVSL
jgi:hypothetical protein